MGYKREPKAYKLMFEDPAYEGLEVIARGLSVGEFLEVSQLSGDFESLEGGTEGTQKLLKIFADKLVGWNLEDEDGKPVKPTYDYLKSEDFDFILTLVLAWMNAIASVNPNLEKTSSPSEMTASLPMETLQNPSS